MSYKERGTMPSFKGLVKAAAKAQPLKSQKQVYGNMFHLIFPTLKDVAGDFLEIGAFKGKTTIFLGKFLERRFPERKIITVDPHCQEHIDAVFAAADRQVNIFDHFVRHTAVLKNHQHLAMSAVEASELIPDGSIAFAFIDGDHSEKAVIEDFGLYLPKMAIGGIMCFDDYRNPAWAGVGRALGQVAKNNPAIEVAFTGRKEIYYRRVS